MPLLRQYFAVNIRDNVGIASLCTVIHTAGMYKSIIIFALVLSSSLTTAQNIPVLSANKQGLIKQAKVWVAEQTKLETDQVEISATDRRLKIPRCDSMFDISFTYPSNQESIRISCPNTNWQVFVGVKLIKNTLGFAFKADMSAITVEALVVGFTGFVGVQQERVLCAPSGSDLCIYMESAFPDYVSPFLAFTSIGLSLIPL